MICADERVVAVIAVCVCKRTINKKSFPVKPRNLRRVADRQVFDLAWRNVINVRSVSDINIDVRSEVSSDVNGESPAD